MLLEKLEKNSEFYIYGAQVVAYGAYKAIKDLTGRVPQSFLVTSIEGNPEVIEDILVNTISNNVRKSTLIILAVTELLQDEIKNFLTIKGYNNIFCLTQHEEYLLMSKYFNKNNLFKCLIPKCNEIVPEVALFEVCNIRDKKLKTYHKLKNYEFSIQAGAALSEKILFDICDNSGENISKLNKQYCEMTATYWVWKNTDYEWKGIEHYRRHLIFSPEWLDNSVDVIMPLPYIAYPNIISQFKRFVSDKVYDALLVALKYKHPKEFNNYMQILNGQYQYTYNLLCARKEIFDSYCEWFFEITQYMEKMSDRIPEIKNTRALSYVAEVLTNLYFMSNNKSLKILHVEKEIYV